MSRHGYTDEGDLEHWEMSKWRGIVNSATRGSRGQAFFLSLRDALDAMPEKELDAEEVIGPHGACCALGALLRQREVPYLGKLVGVDVDELEGWNEHIADDLDVHVALVQEVAYENDEGRYGETPSQRWARMRAWVERQIVESKKAEGQEVQP
jgi:hypothetical protein